MATGIGEAVERDAATVANVPPVSDDAHSADRWQVLWRDSRIASAGLALALFVLYSTVSLTRARHLGTAAYDLGIFDQAVQSYAHFNGPIAALKGPDFNLLGDHFSPILVVLAPLYWVWPSAHMLLVAQAALVAASAYPLVEFAVRRLNLASGLAIGVAYGLSLGIQSAVLFDFHEIAFALPLLAFSLVALLERRWTTALLWALPLALVKEDLGITVAAIGCYLLAFRRWIQGAIAVVLGVGATLLALLVVIPAFDNLTHSYAYWGMVTNKPGDMAATPPSTAQLPHFLATLPTTMTTPHLKVHLVIWTLVFTAFIALRSPIILTALPTLGWRMASANKSYWSVGVFHYDAILMTISFVALAHAVLLLRESRFGAARALSWHTAPVVVAVTLALLPRSAFWLTFRFPQTPPKARHVAAAMALAKLVPSGARVEASDYLVPLVVDRCPTTMFPDYFKRQADYVFVDSRHLGVHPPPYPDSGATLRALGTHGFHRVANRDGIQLYRHG